MPSLRHEKVREYAYRLYRAHCAEQGVSQQHFAALPQAEQVCWLMDAYDHLKTRQEI